VKEMKGHKNQTTNEEKGKIKDPLIRQSALNYMSIKMGGIRYRHDMTKWNIIPP